jgi:hypothetical protein
MSSSSAMPQGSTTHHYFFVARHHKNDDNNDIAIIAACKDCQLFSERAQFRQDRLFISFACMHRMLPCLGYVVGVRTLFFVDGPSSLSEGEDSQHCNNGVRTQYLFHQPATIIK